MNSVVQFLAEPEHLKLIKNLQQLNFRIAVADLKGYEGRAPLPRGLNSFNFMQFFGKILQNHMFAPPEGRRAYLGEILDPPLNGCPNLQHLHQKLVFIMLQFCKQQK